MLYTAASILCAVIHFLEIAEFTKAEGKQLFHVKPASISMKYRNQHSDKFDINEIP